MGLIGGALAGAGLLLPKGRGVSAYGSTPPPPTTAAFQVPLPIPPVLAPTSTDATTDYYTLTMQAGQKAILPGSATPIWGYNGQFPGPTIKAQAGRTVKVHAVNNLGEPTVIHLHGGHTPASSDGHPNASIAPGGLRDYTYPNNQQAATMWYHDHVDGATGKHVTMGLAGFYLISDSFEQGLNLPSGQYDVPLVIADRQFNTDNSFYYPSTLSSMNIKCGLLGNTILVNGAVQPYFQVAARKYRLRFLNGSNARVYELARSDGQPLVQIASDGGLLPQTVSMPSIVIAPGERLEVVVDFSNLAIGTSVILNNTQDTGSLGQIMRFDVASAATDTSALPTTLRAVTPLSTTGAVQRTWTLDYNGNWMINGMLYDPNRIDAQVKLGATEIWTWQNRSGMLHPMHIHDIEFQVLSRGGSGSGVRANEHGWKDTVQVDPWDTVQVIMQFKDNTGNYVFHCHKLEHEDYAMMGQFNVS